ncbi:hypothetical protein TW95_gp1698 [Pandoravirus inopinatum]|uniref:Uncharacterized protein n=1 Tax=Pandoravirus inopinatum TaxID=1605721 RepID=A0A0B5JF24_9VIRU|nr:hypothetical protein TW95_gp1698 [Pandoravirus inopinatum]AJF98432.1 hypothetical protein [Pandoravirus inopinatum]
MLTDTSTFSSSDGKRAYSTTTTTTTTTRTAKRSVLPSASPSPSSSSTASNWSCGWDAPLTSEPTLSSLPTYVFDGTAHASHDGVGSTGSSDNDNKGASLDEQKKKKNKDKKKSKKRSEKKGRDKSARKGRTAARRRPTDAETDAEAYRTNRASDPWARGLSMASAVAALASSKTDTETYQHDDPWTSHGTTAASLSEAEADRRDKWHPRRGTTAHGQSGSSHADTSTSASWQDHKATAHVTPSSSSSLSSSSDDHNSADSQTQSSALPIVATNDDDGESTDDASLTSSSSASSTSSSSLSSKEHTLDTTDDSAPRDYQDRDTTDTTADTQQDSDANDHDDHHNHHNHRDDDNTRGVSDDTASVQESSAGPCQCACCAGSTADSQDTQHQDDDRDDEDGDSDASDDQQYEDGDHDGHADKASLSDTPSSSSIVPSASSSSSSSFSSTAADNWVNVKVGDKAPREPPVYIRACHRGTTHHRGPLCDDGSRDDDHHDHDDDNDDDDDHGSSLHRARKDGVVETHSITIAEPLVRPCEPDAPHAIFGRPCSAHSDHKGRAPRPSAPVVVAPGVRDLPGGIPEPLRARRHLHPLGRRRRHTLPARVGAGRIAWTHARTAGACV